MPRIVILADMGGMLDGKPFSWEKGEEDEVDDHFARAIADGHRAEYAFPDEEPAKTRIPRRVSEHPEGSLRDRIEERAARAAGDMAPDTATVGELGAETIVPLQAEPFGPENPDTPEA